MVGWELFLLESEFYLQSSTFPGNSFQLVNAGLSVLSDSYLTLNKNQSEAQHFLSPNNAHMALVTEEPDVQPGHGGWRGGRMPRSPSVHTGARMVDTHTHSLKCDSDGIGPARNCLEIVVWKTKRFPLQPHRY